MDQIKLETFHLTIETGQSPTNPAFNANGFEQVKKVGHESWVREKVEESMEARLVFPSRAITLSVPQGLDDRADAGPVQPVGSQFYLPIFMSHHGLVKDDIFLVLGKQGESRGQKDAFHVGIMDAPLPEDDVLSSKTVYIVGQDGLIFMKSNAPSTMAFEFPMSIQPEDEIPGRMKSMQAPSSSRSSAGIDIETMVAMQSFDPAVNNS